MHTSNLVAMILTTAVNRFQNISIGKKEGVNAISPNELFKLNWAQRKKFRERVASIFNPSLDPLG
jgi:hypothetical protein